MEIERSGKMVAGFWIRLVSDCIDSILLGLLGLCLAIPFRAFFYRFGEGGVWIGIVITFLYTGLLQSGIGEGQSIAKRILRLQVLKMDGGYLSLPSSFLRYGVIATLFYGTSITRALGYVFPLLARPSFQATIYTCILLLFVGTIIMVPLHPLKRGIHDLISGSIVVYKGTFDAGRVAALEDPAETKKAYIIAGICGLLVVLAVSLGTHLVDSLGSGRLSRVQAQVARETELKNISVQNIQVKSLGKDATTTKYLIVGGFLGKERFDDQNARSLVARKVSQTAKDAYGSPMDIHGINIVIRTGFNIGIYSVSQSLRYAFSAE